MNRCWFCYKDCGDSKFHSSCAKAFFGTAEVPLLQLDKKLIKSLAEQTINKRIAITGATQTISYVTKTKGQEPVNHRWPLG
jgi:serine/threonine-protein kinase HipA